MIMLSGMCWMIAFFTLLTKSLSQKRKKILFAMEVAAALLLMSDRLAYQYRGEMSDAGYWIVRISNFLVFFFMIFVLNMYNEYLKELITEEAGQAKTPVRLRVAGFVLYLAYLLLIISQFTGLYYTFDEWNRYQRSDFFFVCTLLPVVAIIFQISTIITYWKMLPRLIRVSLFLFSIVPIVMSGLQVFIYGLSLNNIGMVAMVILLYVFALIDLNTKVEKANKIRMQFLEEESKKTHTLFVQTATALANAIDAKDKYTHGHSTRVAQYSQEIARLAGESEEMIEEIYFSGLLHDVGKIGVPDAIINKDGRLTDEEFDYIKQHPVIGKQILSSIDVSPYLSIGANYHHERYDGRGYPEGLKGDDIPKIARIIAVADAYDAMTSKRSYRDPIPQQKVREEIVKGMGTQFDPEYAKIMLHLIDLDTEYEMKEHDEVKELAGKDELRIGNYRSDISEGFLMNDRIMTIRMRSTTDADGGLNCVPSLILFDSLDARTHDFDNKAGEMLYFEYAELHVDGLYDVKGARKIQADIHAPVEYSGEDILKSIRSGVDFEIRAVRRKDHAMVDVVTEFQTIKFIVALPDNTRFCYLGLTGEKCYIDEVRVERAEDVINDKYIPRIAEEVSFIKNEPVGDLPNIQMDGWRTDSTKGVPLSDVTTIRFHTKSLPTARLIWHCPFISIFYSADHLVDGIDYREYVLIRLDGENWESEAQADNQMFINTTEGFEGWDSWKQANKDGMDVEVEIRKKGNKITVITENQGVSVRSVTNIKDNPPQVYAALTGDQCAITDIHILHE